MIPNERMDKALKESDIRPNHLMEKQAELFSADIARILKYKDRFVVVACPACQANSSSKAFNKFDFTYVVCSKCQTMYVNPRPTPEILQIYYSSSQNYAYWNKYIFPASENTRREKIFRPRAERIAGICSRYRVKMDTIMEIGAGFGTFCEEILRMNIFKHIVAVEPTPDLANTCRSKGLEVIESSLEQLNLKRHKADVIASFEVIEHIFSPREFLLRCASLLTDGGLLVVTCPNVKGFEISVLQELSDSVDIEHLNYFHPSSLSQLFTECGFEVLEVETPGKLDVELVRKKALEGKLDLSKEHFLKNVLLERWDEVGSVFQQFLADNMLSSHMWLVARKMKPAKELKK